MVAKVLVIGLLATAVAGGTFGQTNVQRLTVNGELDAPTRKEAEATLARGLAWLQAQEAADGRIGTNRYQAVTALALRAVRGAAGITNGRWNGAALKKSDGYLKAFVGSNPTNPGIESFDADVCRKVLQLPGSEKAAQDWASYLATQDRDDSARAREFELREIAWQKQRATLVKQGQDPDRFAAAQLAQAVVPASVTVGRARPPDAPTGAASELAAVSQGSSGSLNPALRKKRRGYGSLTYQGMMHLLYEEVRSNDPRVDAMMDWAERGWSLDENPGKGKAGLFYFYHAMSKCLAASGEEEIVPLLGGTPIRWREEFVRKLVAMQHVDNDQKTGYWVNENPTYMEDDPVLVTTYAMLSLECVLGKQKQ